MWPVATQVKVLYLEPKGLGISGRFQLRPVLGGKGSVQEWHTGLGTPCSALPGEHVWGRRYGHLLGEDTG